MESITPDFKDDNEANTMMLIALLTVPFLVLVPIIAYFALKEKLSPAADNFIKALLNFELLIAIIIIVAGMLPILGKFLIIPAFVVFHIIMMIIVILNLLNKTAISIWAPVKFLR